MTIQDISRFLFRTKQHYVGARLQQGRVLLDSDFNEEAQLDDEDQRLVLRDVVGPQGSPDDGFSLDIQVGDQILKEDVFFNGSSTPTTVINYRIRPGSIYVGGLRFELEPVGFDDGGAIFEPIVFQRDFLQMNEDQAPKPKSGETHSQLAYLYTWEQSITAVEDEEIREKALGGLDTSVRVRRMRQVQVREVENGLECEEAWVDVRSSLEEDFGGTFDADGCELRSGARLQIQFDTGIAQDPCAPCIPNDPGRYLGAQNQAIRIMLVDEDAYVWAFDNASPLYRVRVKDEVSGAVPIEMITLPKDEAHRPVRNTVVEFLPWSAVLDNGEKTADLIGVFAKVTLGFDPDTNEFQIDAADLGQIEDLIQAWDDHHPEKPFLPNVNDPNGQYLFLRVWHQVDEGMDPLISTGPDPANHVLLRRIGLLPVFNEIGGPGDFWVVTVRPDTPQQIVPWNLTDDGGVPPHGPRRFFAPLTLVTLRQPTGGESINSEVVDTVHDCRSVFRPLVRSKGCCTHTVGDGELSHGDFRSVQAAIDALPEAGGKVCVLPGTYKETIVIDNDNIILEGCGPSSRIQSPGGASQPESLIQVKAKKIKIRKLGITAEGQIGILVGDEDPEAALLAQEVELSELEVLSLQGSSFARSGVEVRVGQSVQLRDSELTMDGTITDDSVVVVRGLDILVEGNRIETLQNVSIFGSWGGLQIGGGSNLVEIRRNHIVGGLGHGITLGSLLWRSVVTSKTIRLSTGEGMFTDRGPCRVPDASKFTNVTINNEEFVPESAGDLLEVRIVDNRIENMLANGISVLALVPRFHDDEIDFISADNLLIERNRIIGNMVAPSRLAATTAVVAKKAAVIGGQTDIFGQFVAPPLPAGAILLADGQNIRIRHNDIRNNGVLDPEATAGIFILFGDNIVIDGNRIQNNGRFEPGAATGRFGAPGGIVVVLAGIGEISEEDGPQIDLAGTSLRVVRNIVEHPNGNALFAGATGPVVVEGNHLLSLGNNATSQAPGTTYAVTIFNLGVPWESVDLSETEPDPLRWISPDGTKEYLHRETAGTFGAGGKVLFNNNHVTLNWTPPPNTTSGLTGGFSVGIASLDDVTMVGNQLALNVEDPLMKKKVTGNPIVGLPRILSHAVVVGATVNVSNNRIAEPVNDALISLVVLGNLLASTTHNVLTHSGFSATCNNIGTGTNPPTTIDAAWYNDQGNLVLLRPADTGPLFQLFDQTILQGVANILFTTFCTFVFEHDA